MVDRARRDALAGLPRGPGRRRDPAPRRRGRPGRAVAPDAAFLEVRRIPRPPTCRRLLLTALGFALAGPAPHQAGAPGGATATRTSSSTTAVRAEPALGVVAAAGRRRGRPGQGAALAGGGPHPRRGRGRTCRASPHRRGCTSSSARRPGRRGRLAARLRARRGRPGPLPACSGSTTSAIAVPPDRLNEEVSFLRTLFDLRARRGRGVHGAARPAAQPRLPAGGRSAAGGAQRRGGRRRPRAPSGRHPGRLRLSPTSRAQVRALRARGVPLMPVPDNYYVDLDARFGLAGRRCSPTCGSTSCSTTGSATASCCTPSPLPLATGLPRRAARAARRVRRLRERQHPRAAGGPGGPLSRT